MRITYIHDCLFRTHVSIIFRYRWNSNTCFEDKKKAYYIFCHVYNLAPDQLLHRCKLRDLSCSLFWELHRPLMSQYSHIWHKSGQGNSQIRLRWSEATLSAYIRMPLFVRRITCKNLSTSLQCWTISLIGEIHSPRLSQYITRVHPCLG